MALWWHCGYPRNLELMGGYGFRAACTTAFQSGRCFASVLGVADSQQELKKSCMACTATPQP
eukprot:1158675-Pelagomonas_calceolata.AAC.4